MDILDSVSDVDYVTLKEYYHDLKKFLLLKENDSIYVFFLNLCKRI
ncbi:hypothetical protein J5751_07755 [bacterium]|nr:hypothetical protein [bacterium]